MTFPTCQSAEHCTVSRRGPSPRQERVGAAAAATTIASSGAICSGRADVQVMFSRSYESRPAVGFTVELGRDHAFCLDDRVWQKRQR